jgi:threonine synthase
MTTISLALEDFRSSGWEKAIDESAEKEFFHFAAALRPEAMKAENGDDEARAKLFYFLYEVASIGWEPGSAVTVFRPQCTFSDARGLAFLLTIRSRKPNS